VTLLRLRRDTRPLLRTAAGYLPGRVVPAVVGALTMPALAWFLAPADFGSITLVAAALPYVALLVGDWVVAGYQREAHLENEEDESQAAGWAAALGVAGALLLAAGGLIARRTDVVIVGLLLAPFLMLRMQWTKLLMTGRSGAYSAMQVLYTVARAGGMVAIAAITRDVVAVLAGWVAVTVLVFLSGPRLRLRARPLDPRALRRLAQVGVPLIAASLAINVVATADRFIVAVIQGRAAAGAYAFGYLIGEGLLALATGVPYLAAYAHVTRAWDEGRERDALSLLSILLRVQGAITVAIVGALCVTDGALLDLVAPARYGTVGPVIGVVAAAQLPATVAPYLVLLATLRRQTMRAVVPSVIAAAVNVGLTIPAVHLGGITGAAVVTVATYLIYCALLARAVRPDLLATRGAIAALVAVLAVTGIAVADGATVTAALAALTAVAVAVAASARSWDRTVLGRPRPDHDDPGPHAPERDRGEAVRSAP
jgi:O-antigen/teichoic acid export membrane protein